MNTRGGTAPTLLLGACRTSPLGVPTQRWPASSQAAAPKLASMGVKPSALL